MLLNSTPPREAIYVWTVQAQSIVRVVLCTQRKSKLIVHASVYGPVYQDTCVQVEPESLCHFTSAIVFVSFEHRHAWSIQSTVVYVYGSVADTSARHCVCRHTLGQSHICVQQRRARITSLVSKVAERRCDMLRR